MIKRILPLKDIVAVTILEERLLTSHDREGVGGGAGDLPKGKAGLGSHADMHSLGQAPIELYMLPSAYRYIILPDTDLQNSMKSII